MILRIRTTVFWPGIQHEVKDMANQCDTCQRHKPSKQREMLHPHDFGQFPWEKVGADLCELYGQQYLGVVDYYFTYIEIDSLSTTVKHHREDEKHICKMGPPRQLIKDCGAQFLSAEFETFLQNWEIDHRTSSPHYHCSNGKAEATVKAVKTMIQKCKDTNQDPLRPC